MCGLLIGVICQRSKFCVVRAFREPFLTGMSEAPIGVFAALLVGIFGFTLIKYMGIGTNSPEEARTLALTGVYANFWLRGLIGGVIFGVGMVLAGGCAVGTMWRVGEGHVQLWLAALGIMLAAPLSKKFLVPKFAAALPEWGKLKVFLADWVGYGGAVLIFLLIILVWYWFVTWNERTDKFTCM
ncbi:MAG: YeeE/YedE family protein [Verrucomicrobia bacterium]|nr:YeeE/YedE family protein [Verrucomicrobiota bacterium]